jgi:hypothetical protein
MVRVVFTGQQFSQWQDQWDEPTQRRNRSYKQWDDYGDRDPRERDDLLLRTHERELRPLSRPARESYQEEDPSSLVAPVRYKDPSRNNRNKVVDDLLYRMNSLSLRDRTYVTLYGRCAQR